MKNSSFSLLSCGALRCAGFASATLPLLCYLSVSGTVLDNFAGAKTGWPDGLGGSIVQSAGQFTITTATGNGSLAYSKKTATNYANALGATLEFRVDVNTVTPPNGDTNALAILAWVPAGGAV